MANDVNQVVLSGRLAKNPLLKTSAKGTSFFSLSSTNNRKTATPPACAGQTSNPLSCPFQDKNHSDTAPGIVARPGYNFG